MRRTLITVSVLLCALGILSWRRAAANTQGAKDTPTPQANVAIPPLQPRPQDVSSIDGMIKANYEVVSGPAEKAREWGRDATLYVPGIRFNIFSEDKQGKTTVRSLSHQDFVNESESAMKGKAFYEHEIHRIAHRAGNVAHILSTAEQRLAPDGPVQGHSVDSLELYWDGARWWIVNANIWEVEKSGKPLPAEFLP
jgi:hypothetical protein